MDQAAHPEQADLLLSRVPVDLLRPAAARAGVKLLALTDHDTLAGVEEALSAGAEHGVAVVPFGGGTSVVASYSSIRRGPDRPAAVRSVRPMTGTSSRP